MEKRIARITLEIAEERMRKLENRETYRILEWNGTANPCTIECEKCGIIFTIKKGIGCYTEATQPRFQWKPCRYCAQIKEKNSEKNP